MAKGWEKRNCYVVHAWYRYELYKENETPMKEEECFLSESKAEECKARYEADEDFEEVYIEEDEREFWVDIEEKNTNPDEQKILEMAAKIEQNHLEDKIFMDNVDRYISGKMPTHEVITIGQTPNVLKLVIEKLGEATSEHRNLTISQGVIQNSINDGSVVRHNHTSGHEIPIDVIKRIPEYLRNPIMICKGSGVKTLAVITELKNKDSHNILASIKIDVRGKTEQVDKITSLYGKEDMRTYLEYNEILAYNKEKADKLFTDIGANSPQSTSILCFDNSISYTTENVIIDDQKYLEIIGSENKIADTVQEPDVKSPGVTSETNSANFVSSNQNIKLIKETVNDKICKDLKKNNFQPTQSLVNNMKKLNRLTGQKLFIKDVSNIYSGIKDLEVQDTVRNIVQECAQQEKMRSNLEIGK